MKSFILFGQLVVDFLLVVGLDWGADSSSLAVEPEQEHFELELVGFEQEPSVGFAQVPVVGFEREPVDLELALVVAGSAQVPVDFVEALDVVDSWVLVG